MFRRWCYKIWYAILFYWKALEKAILGFAIWYSEVLMADERSISFVLKFLELHSSSSRTPFHGVLGDAIDIPSQSSQWKTIRAMYWDIPSYGHWMSFMKKCLENLYSISCLGLMPNRSPPFMVVSYIDLEWSGYMHGYAWKVHPIHIHSPYHILYESFIWHCRDTSN